MIVHMQLELKDVPGSLIRVLEPISSHGGNIVSVMHSRGEKKRVLVEIVFKIGDLRMLELIKNLLRQRHIRATRIDIEGRKYYAKKIVDCMFVGHVIDTDLQDTIDRINEFGLVSDIDVVMPSPEEKSSVLLQVEVDERKASSLLKRIKDVCSEKRFLLVRSLD
ncbi:MAG: ACT domain-containing protein [Candidatus Altiarchaeota archaeon]